MQRDLRRLATETDGATAIEYALIAGTIALGIISTVSLLAPTLNDIFGQVASFFS